MNTDATAADHPQRRTHRSVIVVAAGVLVLVVCVATALLWKPLRSGRSGSQAAIVTQSQVPPMTGHQLVLVHGADDLAQLEPSRYGGGWWDETTGQAMIGVLSADQMPDTRTKLDAQGLQEVQIQVVRNSITHLRELERLLVSAPSPLQETLVSAGPDLVRNHVVVTAETITPEIVRQIAQIAGDDAVVAKSSGRFSDLPAPIT